MLTIAIGSDHAGFNQKEELISLLMNEEGIFVIDCGCPDTITSHHYPKYASRVTNNIIEGAANLGVLICGTGIGMSIAANKCKGIRAALIHDAYTAHMARQHNNANVICLAARKDNDTKINSALMLHYILTFIDDEFESRGRHSERLKLIQEIEKGKKL